MPIKPENKGRYPKDWKAIRERILERAEHACEKCGALNHTIAAGKVEPVATELVPVILAFRDAYRQTFGSK